MLARGLVAVRTRWKYNRTAPESRRGRGRLGARRWARRSRTRTGCAAVVSARGHVIPAAPWNILPGWLTSLNPLPAVARSAAAAPVPSSVESCALASVFPISLARARRPCGFTRYARLTSARSQCLKHWPQQPAACLIGRTSSARHSEARQTNDSSGSTAPSDLRVGKPTAAAATSPLRREVGVSALYSTKKGVLLPEDTCTSLVAGPTSRQTRS